MKDKISSKKRDLAEISGGKSVFEKVEDTAEDLALMFEKGLNRSVEGILGKKNVDRVWNSAETAAGKVVGFFSGLTR